MWLFVLLLVRLFVLMLMCLFVLLLWWNLDLIRPKTYQNARKMKENHQFNF